MRTFLSFLFLFLSLNVLASVDRDEQTAVFTMNSFQLSLDKDIPLGDIVPEGKIDDDKFSKYLHDSCQVKKPSIANEDELRSLYLRRCKDGTVSFKQPSSEGYKGWEGKCGQTAASNLMYGYCKIVTSPKSYTNKYLSDYTPGVRPGTLISGLDSMFKNDQLDCPSSKSWHAYSYGYEKHYIASIKRGLKTTLENKYKVKRTRSDGSTIYRTPVALLIRSPGGHALHWVTVVDLVESGESCHMFVNHWDDQYKVPCSKIAKWSRGVANSFGAILNKYYVIKYK